MYELFGTSFLGQLEYLGTFPKKEYALKAFDSYWGLGYRKLKICKIDVR
ncbi:MAG: hypothetical protein PUC68_08110 [Firmicutes bacterium]|nr:hypothetical protein [Bacillota bacterium]